MENKEAVIWSGKPSQMQNFGTYLLCILFCFLIIPIFIMIWKWISLNAIKYQLTSQRLKTISGVFNQQVDELELYRVKDYRIEKPFWLRLYSLGNIILETSDKSSPIFVIEAVKGPEKVKDTIRDLVEDVRDNKGVKEVDFQ